MKEIKLRYTFKHRSDNHIYQLIVPISVLEDKHGEIFSMLCNNLWELVRRDLFTNLKDKSSREIFYNDIVQFKNKNNSVRNFLVCQDNDYFATHILELPNLRMLNPKTYINVKKAKLLEIIGNRWENPELLGK